MFDDMMEAFHLAHRMPGFRLADADIAHLDAALNLLQQQRPLLRKYESNLINEMLSSGEVALAQNWNGKVLRLNRERPEFKFVVPREGALMFIDNMCLLKTAPHPDAAHRFLNFLLEPENASKNMQTILYAMPHPEAKNLLPSDLQNDPTMFPPPGDMSGLDVMPDLSPVSAGNPVAMGSIEKPVTTFWGSSWNEKNGDIGL